jgi:hypothetical protein
MQAPRWVLIWRSQIKKKMAAAVRRCIVQLDGSVLIWYLAYDRLAFNFQRPVVYGARSKGEGRPYGPRSRLEFRPHLTGGHQHERHHSLPLYEPQRSMRRLCVSRVLLFVPLTALVNACGLQRSIPSLRKRKKPRALDPLDLYLEDPENSLPRDSLHLSNVSEMKFGAGGR